MRKFYADLYIDDKAVNAAEIETLMERETEGMKMARYIDANIAKKNLESASIATRFVDDVPTADVKPVVRGEWINTYADDEGIGDFVKHCSVCCNAIIKSLSASLNFCPNCGAKMEDKP